MGNIKKVQKHEYHVSEQRREVMDVRKPKRGNEYRNCFCPNKQADIVADATIINHVKIGNDHRMIMSNIKQDVEVKMK